MRKFKVNDSKLAEYMALVGQEAETIANDGTPITNEEQLARLLWKKANGYTEDKVIEDAHGNKGTERIVHPPEKWAAEIVLAYTLGRPHTNEKKQDDTGRLTAAETVRSLGREQLENLFDGAGKDGPPDMAHG